MTTAALIALLDEARDHLEHTRCIDDDALKCPACGIESRIDAAIASLQRGEFVLVAVPPTNEQDHPGQDAAKGDGNG